jgi:steroid delta-isomerase-like uncharacterized protein
MSTANKELVRRVYDEVINGGNVALIDELFAADFVDHEEFPGLEGGREGVKQFFTMMRTAFPDLRMAIDDLIAEGDKVVARATMSGTHKGEFMGMDPSGKQFRVSAIDVVRFADRKAVEHWGITDAAAMMEQLGAVPAASA